MAGRGPAPKRELTRPNDTARRDAEMVRVAADGVLRGRDLPDHDWNPRTLRWWDTWRRSPQAQTFVGTDWDFLEDTAFLYDAMANGDTGLAAELRLRVAKFGATPEDRLRLKMSIDDTVDVAPVPQRLDDDRKRRLMSVVND